MNADVWFRDPSETLGVYSTYQKALLAGNKWFLGYSGWKVGDTQVRRVNRRGESPAIMKGSAPT